MKHELGEHPLSARIYRAMKISPLKQRDESDCGPTSIHMAVRYFGLPYSFEQIATISQYIKKDGLSNEDLVETFKNLGLDVRAQANATWEDLQRSNTPDTVIVVSWMKFGYIGHFSVVENVEKDCIELADPQEGKIITMEKIPFMRLWMDYDDMWYPSKNTDIQLRWMCVVSTKRRTKA
ncbi:MAG: cysteine peptidase family C39 domain-containing protein [Candidatus Peribacteraceae bacterium]